MVNKEVEEMLNEIHKNACRPLLDFEKGMMQLKEISLRARFKQLEKENAEQKKNGRSGWKNEQCN